MKMRRWKNMAQKSDYILGEILMQLHELEEKIRELQRQTYAEAWEEGEREGRGCRMDENVFFSPHNKTENEMNVNMKIDAKTTLKSSETHEKDSNLIPLFKDEKEQEMANKNDFESGTGSEVLLHVQPKSLDEVNLPKIENIPMPAPASVQPKEQKRMCPTCHRKIVVCIRKNGTKYECCERSPYNINIADRASRGSCTGWFQEIDG